MAEVPEQNRPLTAEQYALLRWMLEHADERAASFVSQLDHVRVTAWRCPCGCASFDMIVEGMPEPSGGMELLADFTFGPPDQLCGIFPYAQNGVLAGVEVTGYAVDAPKVLPTIESLRVAGQPPAG